MRLGFGFFAVFLLVTLIVGCWVVPLAGATAGQSQHSSGCHRHGTTPTPAPQYDCCLSAHHAALPIPSTYQQDAQTFLVASDLQLVVVTSIARQTLTSFSSSEDPPLTAPLRI